MKVIGLFIFILIGNMAWGQNFGKPVFHLKTSHLLIKDQAGNYQFDTDIVEVMKRAAAFDGVELLLTNSDSINHKDPVIKAKLDSLRSDLGGNNRLHFWWEKTNTNIKNIRANQINSKHYAYIGFRSPKTKERVFADMVHTYHNFHEDKLSLNKRLDKSSWSDTYREKLFILGPDAFDPTHKTETLDLTWGKEADSDQDSVQCIATFDVRNESYRRVLDIEYCKEKLGFNYKWINAAEKTCGEYTLDNQFIQQSYQLNCEPEHIQSFENYISQNINPLCQEFRVCIEKVTGDETAELTNSIINILNEANLSHIRERNYGDANFDYVNELEERIRELKEINLFCKKTKSQQILANHLANDPKFESDYKNAISELNEAFVAIRYNPHQIPQDQLFGMFDQAKVRYDECVAEKLDNNIERPTNELFLYEVCQVAAHNSLINSYRDHLGSQYDGAGKDEYLSLLQNETSRCDFEEYPGEVRAERSVVRRVELRTDLANCSALIDRIAAELPGRLTMIENSSQELVLTSGLSEDEKTDFRNTFANEVRFDSQVCRRENNRPACEQRVYQENIYDAYLDQLQSRNTEVYNKVGESLVLRNRVIDDLISRPEVRDCFDRVNTGQEQANICEQMVIASVDRVEETAPSALAGEETLASEALAADFGLITRTLSRDISTFHYGDSVSWLGSSTLYARMRQSVFHVGPTGNFWTPDAGGGTMMGRGLYAASDPAVTSGYGDGLLEIPAKAGESYLDLRGYERGFPISFDTYRKLIDNGCYLNNYQTGVYYDTDDTMTNAERDKLLQENRKHCEGKKKELKDQYDVKVGQANGDQTVLTNASSWYQEELNLIDLECEEKKRAILLDFNNSHIARSRNYVDTSLNSIKVVVHGDTSPGGVYATVSKGIFEVFEKCNEIFSAALAEADVNFLAYDYEDRPPEYCNRRDRAPTAFVMIDASFRGHQTYSQADIREAIEEKERSNRPLPPEIKRILQGVSVSSQAKRGLSESEGFSPEVVSYWRSRLFNCDVTMEEDDYIRDRRVNE